MMKRLYTLVALIMCVLLLSACGGGETEQKTVDLGPVYDELIGSFELPEMVVVPENRLERAFGVKSEDCAQVVIALCADSVRADEIWLVEAVDEEAAQRIEALAEARLEQRKGEMENYLPDQYAVLCDAQLIREGRYVALFVAPESKGMADVFRSALG